MSLRSRTYANLVKLTVFAVITAFLTLILALTISNGGIGGSYTTYRADFTDVTNLSPGDDVRIAGVRIGQVQGIKIVDNRYAQVTFTVQKAVPVYASTQAEVRYRNLVGQRYIQLSESPGSGALLAANGTIPLAQTQPALDLTTLFNGFKPLFQALSPKDVNTLSYDIVQTLQGEGGTVDSLLANTASLTNTIANRDAVVGRVVDNLNTVLGTVDQRDAGLNELIVQLQRLVTGLAGDRQTIAASLGNIGDLAGSTASLLQGIRPPLPGDFAGLSGLASALANTKDPNGSNTLDTTLKYLPDKLNTLIRTASYGSYFNFFLCDADFVLGHNLSPVHLHNTTAPACQSGGGG